MNTLKTSLFLYAALGLGGCSENTSPAKEVNATRDSPSKADTSTSMRARATPVSEPRRYVESKLVRMESRNNSSPEDMVALGKILSERLAKR